MEVEIQEFYWDEEPPQNEEPIRKKKNKGKSGTLHIYLPQIDLDIRGILFIKHKNGWIMRMPHKTAFENGKRVFYPVLTFVNLDTMKELILQIKEKGTKFIEDKLKVK